MLINTAPAVRFWGFAPDNIYDFIYDKILVEICKYIRYHIPNHIWLAYISYGSLRSKRTYEHKCYRYVYIRSCVRNHIPDYILALMLIYVYLYTHVEACYASGHMYP